MPFQVIFLWTGLCPAVAREAVHIIL